MITLIGDLHGDRDFHLETISLNPHGTLQIGDLGFDYDYLGINLNFLGLLNLINLNVFSIYTGICGIKFIEFSQQAEII